MKHFKCPDCGSDILIITYDATLTHRVTMKEAVDDNPFEYETGVYSSDYSYLYAYCGECHQEIYEGKYPDRLWEAIVEEGWYNESIY